MSCADKTSFRSNADVPLRIWPSWPAVIWRRFCDALELRRQRRYLRDLDDRQLADIGVTREQALREANKLFWTRV